MKIMASGRMRSFSLLISDILLLAVSISAVFFCFSQYNKTVVFETVFNTWPVFVLMISFNMCGRLYCGNIFYPGQEIHPVEELRRLILGCAGSFIIFAAVFPETECSTLLFRTVVAVAMTVSLVALPIGRIIVRFLLWKLNAAYIPAVITGDADLVRSVVERIQSDAYSVLEIKATCCGTAIAGNIPDLSFEKLISFTSENRIHYVICCNGDEKVFDNLKDFISGFTHILVVNNASKFPVLWSYPVSFYRFFSFEVSNRLIRKSVLFQKRVLEIIFAAVALVMLALPGILLAALVKITSRGPVFYRAKRLGKNGRTIEVLKFRTMRENAEYELEQLFDKHPDMRLEWEHCFKLENDPRITSFGRFLRRTSLDELPQFWNILKGDMALIGPRPIVSAEVKYYGKDYPVFSSVKPGITGLWQVSGRSDTGYEERVALDVFYVNNWSIWMDCYIFFATINAVFLQRGAK